MAESKTAPKKAAKAPAVILTLGGAPPVAHTIPGLYGTFRPDRPTPVGGPGELTVAQAAAASEDPGCPLELVDVPASDVPGLRLQAEADRRADAGLPPREKE